MAVELTKIANSIFTGKNWDKITQAEKEESFFIFKRFFSKKYPEVSLLLNNNNQNKSIGMDLLFYFMRGKPYTNWFWNISKEKEKNKISKNDFNLLKSKLNLKDSDLEYLISNHIDFIKNELKYYKKLANL